MDEILDFAKFAAGGLELEHAPFCPANTVLHAVATVSPRAQQKGVGVVVDDLRPLPATILGDNRCLSQVLQNLLSNAVQATDRGTVRVGAEVKAQTPNRVELRFFVADTGCGIPQAKCDSIFDVCEHVDRSVPGRCGGAGLSLAICARLVRGMGGEIGVDSREGIGSTFHFTAVFDVDRTEAPRLPPQAAPGGRPGGGSDSVPPERALRILLAEDEEVSREVALRILSRRGHSVTAASGGQEALAIWEADPAAFDVLVTDLSMPEMGGLELTRAIRQRESASGRHLPILGMAAFAMKSDAERCLAEGMDSCVAKPIHRDEFLRVVESLRSRVPAPEAPNVAASRPPTCDVPQLLANYDGDLEFVAELVAMFVDSCETGLPELRAAVASADVADVARRAHRLKGSVGNLCGRAMQAAALSMEQHAKAGDASVLPALLAELEQEYQRLKPVLQAVVNGEVPP